MNKGRYGVPEMTKVNVEYFFHWATLRYHEIIWYIYVYKVLSSWPSFKFSWINQKQSVIHYKFSNTYIVSQNVSSINSIQWEVRIFEGLQKTVKLIERRRDFRQYQTCSSWALLLQTSLLASLLCQFHPLISLLIVVKVIFYEYRQ